MANHWRQALASGSAAAGKLPIRSWTNRTGDWDFAKNIRGNVRSYARPLVTVNLDGFLSKLASLNEFDASFGDVTFHSEGSRSALFLNEAEAMVEHLKLREGQSEKQQEIPK